MATSDDDFDMTELDLLGPLIPNFHLETDVLDGLESADLTVPEETTGEVSEADQHEPTAVPAVVTADDVDTSGVLGDNPTDGVAYDCGRRYAEMAVSETTKNHKGGLDDNQNVIKPRMYETKKPDCPVAALTKYLSKRNPTSNIFFQQSRVKVNNEDEMWYTSRPVEERLLNNMMVDISKSAGLSQIYTNHGVRATTVTVLAQSGVPKTDIMKITGRKSEASLESYYQDSSEKQKRQYSAILLGNTENGSDKSGSTAPVQIFTQPNAMPSSTKPATSFNTHV